MKVWKFDREDEPGNPFILDERGLSGILDELKNSDIGDCYTIHIEDMQEEQFKTLPEWDGW